MVNAVKDAGSTLPHLSDLRLGEFRNIQVMSLKPCPGLNFFQGPNGAGKTSILEAIHVLSCGRSFKGSAPRDIVRRGQPGFYVAGKLSSSENEVQLGIAWDQGVWTAKLNGERVNRISTMASLLPLAVVEPGSSLLLTGGPEGRRNLYDKLMFHVKHGYAGLLTEYRRALSQRNAGLRSGHGGADLAAYERLMSDSATEIHQQRGAVFSSFQENLSDCIARLTSKELRVGVEYVPGWNTDQGLAENLARDRSLDMEMGYTRLGPHRLELRLVRDGKLIRKSFSRGEIKAVVVAMIMAQVITTAKLSKRRCLIVLDDLFSELDADRSARVLEFFGDFETQLFLSGVEPHAALDSWRGEKKVFHVEQGHLLSEART